MLYKDVKMEKRGENEPKFNPKNKTDRKIVITMVILSVVLLILIAGFVALYYLVIKA